MPGSFFKSGSEKRVQRVVGAALPGHTISVEMSQIKYPDGVTTVLVVHVEGSSILAQFSTPIPPEQVFATMQTMVKAAGPAADYPVRCSVTDSSNQHWLYDYWRDQQPWLA